MRHWRGHKVNHRRGQMGSTCLNLRVKLTIIWVIMKRYSYRNMNLLLPGRLLEFGTNQALFHWVIPITKLNHRQSNSIHKTISYFKISKIMLFAIKQRHQAKWQHFKSVVNMLIFQQWILLNNPVMIEIYCIMGWIWPMGLEWKIYALVHSMFYDFDKQKMSILQ